MAKGRRRTRNLLQLLVVAVGRVPLVACVNVANLVLVCATGRGQEFAVPNNTDANALR